MPDGVEFEFASFEVIDEGAGFVGVHIFGVVDHVIGEGEWEGVAEGVGGVDDFVHEVAHELLELGLVEDAFGVEVTCGDGEAVEGDVPDEFAPACEVEAGFDFAGDLGVVECVGDGLGVWLGWAAVFADGDETLGAVVDEAWGDAVDADEAEAAEDALGAEVLG